MDGTGHTPRRESRRPWSGSRTGYRRRTEPSACGNGDANPPSWILLIIAKPFNLDGFRCSLQGTTKTESACPVRLTLLAGASMLRPNTSILRGESAAVPDGGSPESPALLRLE